MINNYEIQLVSFSKIIIAKMNTLAKRFKVPVFTVWQDLDTMLINEKPTESPKMETKYEIK